MALLAARALTLRGRPPADALKLVTYASDQVHGWLVWVSRAHSGCTGVLLAMPRHTPPECGGCPALRTFLITVLELTQHASTRPTPLSAPLLRGHAQTHSCYQKACMIAGIPHVRVLPTRAEDDYALQVGGRGWSSCTPAR